MRHKKIIWIAAVIAAVAFALLLRSPAKAQSESAHQTVWSGIYTDAQASRGIQSYMGNCSPCHGTDLEGVAHLKGDDFMERWREFDARSLYDFISTSMPRKRNGSPNSPGSLSPDTYLDIIAYIFRANSFPSGTQELTAEAMKNIQIEGKDGPKSVPNGALVQLVGCMRMKGADWVLTDASEPARTSTSATSTPEEMEKAKAKGLGILQFTLQNFGYLGKDFDPVAFAAQKIQTKGYVTRQPGRNRIDVTSLALLGMACP